MFSIVCYSVRWERGFHPMMHHTSRKELHPSGWKDQVGGGPISKPILTGDPTRRGGIRIGTMFGIQQSVNGRLSSS